MPIHPAAGTYMAADVLHLVQLCFLGGETLRKLLRGRHRRRIGTEAFRACSETKGVQMQKGCCV